MSVFVEVERGQNKHWDYSLIFASTPSGKDKTGIPIFIKRNFEFIYIMLQTHEYISNTM